MRLDIWNTLNNRQKISANILLEHQVYISEHEGLNYVVIEVPRANRKDKPVFVGTDMFTGTFKRNHEGDYHCTKEEIKTMLRDQSDTSADSTILDNVSIDTLNADSIKDYRARFKNIREDHIWNKLPTEDFLIKIGAARISEVNGEVHPTLGGLIFFGDFINITNELPNFFLDYREKDPDGPRWQDRVCSGDADWSGNVYDFYYRIINRLVSDVKRPFKLDDNLIRIDDTAIHKGVRECLANALIHADYYGRRGIVIDKEFRKITISNPGTFRVDISEAIAGGISDARNTRIFNMFSLINIGERSGIGLCDVYNTWKTNGFKEPELFETVEPDRVTLVLYLENEGNPAPNEGNPAPNEGNPAPNEGNPAPNEGNLAPNEGNQSDAEKHLEMDLKTTEVKVFLAIKENNSLSIREISKELGLSHATVERALKALKEAGYLKRTGSTRGVWSVLK